MVGPGSCHILNIFFLRFAPLKGYYPLSGVNSTAKIYLYKCFLQHNLHHKTSNLIKIHKNNENILPLKTLKTLAN